MKTWILVIAFMAVGILIFKFHLGIFVFVYLPASLLFAVFMVWRSRRLKQPKATLVCAKCGKSLADFHGSVTHCPYCGEPLKEKLKNLKANVYHPEQVLSERWELYGRKVLGLLLLIPQLPVAVLTMGAWLIFAFPFFACGAYILRSKTRRLTFEVSMLLLSGITFSGILSLLVPPEKAGPLGIYICRTEWLKKMTLPLASFPFILFDANLIALMVRSLLLTASIFLVVTNILSRQKNSHVPRNIKRATALLLCIVPLCYTILVPPTPPNLGYPIFNGSVTGRPRLESARVKFFLLKENECWIYIANFSYIVPRWVPPKPMNITKIALDNEIIAPPFTSPNIEVTGEGFKVTAEAIIIYPNGNVTIRINVPKGCYKLAVYNSFDEQYWARW